MNKPMTNCSNISIVLFVFAQLLALLTVVVAVVVALSAAWWPLNCFDHSGPSFAAQPLLS